MLLRGEGIKIMLEPDAALTDDPQLSVPFQSRFRGG